jgi:DNA-binding MarR family transcriptional regulator
LQLVDLITLSAEKDDRRQRRAALTVYGIRAARELQQFHEDRVRELLEGLPRRQRWRLVAAMRAIVEIHERDPVKNIVDRMMEDRG